MLQVVYAVKMWEVKQLISESSEMLEETEKTKVTETSEIVEEEYGEEFTIQDLEFFIEITELWESILHGKTPVKELIKAKKTGAKVKPKRRKRK